MGLYERFVLPKMIGLACGTGPVEKQRQKVVPLAEGRVLEVGMGPGLNLPFYDPSKVELVWGLEPGQGMRRQAASRLEAAPFEVRWLDRPCEEVPLDDDSADTVLLTYTLCTIRDFQTALAQMRRVLKPGGKLLFCEHGAAPDAGLRKWQDRVNPAWKAIAGGCHINREIPRLIEEAGFEIGQLETMYLPRSPRIAGFQYWGWAKQT